MFMNQEINDKSHMLFPNTNAVDSKSFKEAFVSLAIKLTYLNTLFEWTLKGSLMEEMV